MSELISGKEAAQAFIDGKQVEFLDKTGQWRSMIDNTVLKVFLDHTDFRLKPRTITLNNIEVPAPFEPKEDCLVYILDDSRQDGFREYDYDIEDTGALFFGVWRNIDEIKQVVSALRSAFKGGV